MTSRYLRFSAEQVRTTPCEPEDRRWRDSSRNAVSQSQRSASVSGMPLDIFSTLDLGWNCGAGMLERLEGVDGLGRENTSSPSM